MDLLLELKMISNDEWDERFFNSLRDELISRGISESRFERAFSADAIRNCYHRSIQDLLENTERATPESVSLVADNLLRKFGRVFEGTLKETTIYKMNPKAPMDPEISISGMGSMKLSQAKQNLSRKFEDLAKGIKGKDDPFWWRQAEQRLNNKAMHAIMDSVIEAHDELEKIRKKGGPNSRGIIKE